MPDCSRAAALVLAASLTLAPAARSETPLPSEVGQDAFAALGEIARVLEADPATDWEKVDLLALREHLVDMARVTLDAAIEEKPVELGVEITVRGEGRTLDALQRMIPMHVHAVMAEGGPKVAVAHLPDGFVLTLTADGPVEAARLRGLGFFGFLAAGDHHRRHHLGIAKGTMEHGHGAGHQHSM